MKQSTKKSYLALAIAAALSSNVALAEQVEESQNANEPGLERIEITARKSVESLQEVPVAVE